MTKISSKITVHMRNSPIQTYNVSEYHIGSDGEVWFTDKQNPNTKYCTHISNVIIEENVEVV